MSITPEGEAFVSERRLAAYLLPVGELQIGRRFAPGSDFLYISPTPRHAGGWPGSVWRVGSLEGVKGRDAWGWTASAFVPLERLEPWQSFGPNGERIVNIIERILRFDAQDVAYLRERLGGGNREPVLSAAVKVPAGWARPSHVVRSHVVTAAERTDPEAVADRAWENGYQGDPRSLESPGWEQFLTTADDAVTALFVDADPALIEVLERRFWDLVVPTSGVASAPATEPARRSVQER